MPAKKSLRSAHIAESCALRHAIDRCHNPNHTYYLNYGGRGISVDPIYRQGTWGFYKFIEEVGLRPGPEYSLDRIDNDRGYEPNNMRWATREEQQRNRRASRNVADYGWGWGTYTLKDKRGTLRVQQSPLIEYKGTRQTLVEWARQLGLECATLRQRMAKNWPLDVALSPNLFRPMDPSLSAALQASKSASCQTAAQNCIELLDASITALSRRQH